MSCKKKRKISKSHICAKKLRIDVKFRYYLHETNGLVARGIERRLLAAKKMAHSDTSRRVRELHPGHAGAFFYKISLFLCLWIKTRRGTFTAWLTFNQVIKRSISLDEIISLSSGFDLYVFSPFFSHSTESN